MPGRLRRMLGQVRFAIGYWWLEQTDEIRSRRRGLHHARLAALVSGAATALADRWSGVRHGMASRSRRIAHTLGRHLPDGTSRLPRSNLPRSAWQHRRWPSTLTATGDRFTGLGVGAARRRFARRIASLRTRSRDLLSPGKVSGVAKAVALLLALLGSLLVRQQLFDDGAGHAQGIPRIQPDGPRGPGFTQPGIHLSVSPQESGVLDVVERVVLPEPTSVLPLAAPPSPPDARGPAARLVDLRVVADDVPLTLTDSTEVEHARELSLPRPATGFELHYRVENAEQQSAAAPSGRATIAIRPATSAALSSQPAVVQVRGGAVVHTLVCVEAPRDRQLCGVDAGDGWYTQPVSASRASVLALVDLPGT